jgi:uncharacterized iron-regulated membrane protein
MTLRRVLFWAHLTAGVCAGLVILTMSFTGVLLMYERQLIEWSDRAYRTAPPSDQATRLPIETLLARAVEQRPQQAPTAITLRADRSAPAAIAFGQTTLYQDVYSGRLVGEPTASVRRVMSEARAWHRWLSLDGDGRAVGKAISGWSNLVFLFIVLSGMYLWIPRSGWRGVRAVARFRTGLRGKARDFNWHNVIGIWSAVPLAIIVATAAPISFPWANALVYRIAGEAPPAPAAPAGRTNTSPRAENAPRAVSTDGLDGLWARAEQQIPGWRSINLRLAGAGEGPAVFTIDEGNGGQPQLRSTLSLNRKTGEVVRWEPFAAQTAGRRLRSWTRFTHTGEYYGLVGQTVAGIASAGAVVLVVTGLSLALRRAAGWRARRSAHDREAARSEAA